MTVATVATVTTVVTVTRGRREGAPSQRAASNCHKPCVARLPSLTHLEHCQSVASVSRGWLQRPSTPLVTRSFGLSVQGDLLVEARGPAGEPRESSWQTLLPIVSERPLPVSAGDHVEVNLAVELGEKVAKAPRYVLAGSYEAKP